MRKSLVICGYIFFLGLSLSSYAMTPLNDNTMAQVSGSGLAFALDHFRFMMRPTSYFEEVGTAPESGAKFQRGDLRWYGLSMTGTTGTGYQWNDDLTGTTHAWGTPCSSAASLGCPRGGKIDWFSPYDNPYMIRAYSPEGYGRNGHKLNTGSAVDKTVYEYLAPTKQPNYKFSFWGELEVGRHNNQDGGNVHLAQNTGSILKSQTIIQGNAQGSVFRMFNMTGDNSAYGNSAGEYALFYHSHLQGDFRFSTAQDANNTHDASTTGSDIVGKPVVFDQTGGLYFKNVDAKLYFGQLYYQALTLKAVGNNGNFGVFIPAIPDNPTVYGAYYALRDDDSDGYKTARMALLGDDAYVGVAGSEQTGSVAVYTSYGCGFLNLFTCYQWDHNEPQYGGYDYRTLTSSTYSKSITLNCKTGGHNGTVCPPTNPITITSGMSPVTTWDNNHSGLKNYDKTHGYSIWGDWYPSCYDPNNSSCYDAAGNRTLSGHGGTRNAYNATDDGIYFQSCSACGDMTAFARVMTKFSIYDSNKNKVNQPSYTYYQSANGHTEVVNPGASNATITSRKINLGDSRIYGMIINKVSLISCMGLGADCQ